MKILKNFITNFLTVYENESFLLYQKAKIFLSICIIAIVFIVILPIYDILVLKNITIQFLGPLVGGVIVILLLLLLLKKGHFYISANGVVISVTTMLWLILFLDELEPLSRVDSISYILAVMTIASLAVTRNVYGLLIYAFINVILIVIFVFYHLKLGFFSQESLIDYLVDNVGSIIIITVICRQFYNITNKALEKAENEINRNVELNKELDNKVKYRTRELETAMLELSAAHEKLTTASQKLWSEMELANKIQTMLIPENPVIPGYEINSFMLPAEQIGGDYYDVINIDDVHWVFIGDVSGHGIPAGLVMMMTQTSVQTIVRELPDRTPAEVLKSVNRAIQHNMKSFDEKKFMTISAFKFKENSIEYSGFHENILVYRHKEKKVDCIETRGLWLGVPFVSRFQDEVSEFDVESGDVILLYTDGITEAFKDTTDKQFGVETLSSILLVHGEVGPQAISANVILTLGEYILHDDASLLVIKKL